MQIGAYMLDKFHPKIHAAIGCSIIVLAILFSSYANNFEIFFLLFSVLVGLGYGIVYMLTLKPAWVYFPNRKGMVGGIILSCYSFGAIVLSFLCAELSNPDNLVPTDKINEGATDEFLFDINSQVV